MGRVFDAWGPGISKFLESIGGNLYAQLNSIQRRSVPPSGMVFKHLINAGNTEMSVDGSVTPVAFQAIVPSGKQWKIERVNMYLLDGGIRHDRFAGLAGGLANGLRFTAVDADNTTELIDFLDGQPILINAHFTKLAGVDNMLVGIAGGDDQIQIRWTMSKSGAPLLLTAGQRLSVTVQDDLTSITSMSALIQGVVEDSETPDP